MADFKLPDLGEGVTEAEIDRWLVSEGDHVAEDAPLVDVITDKATAEIPSPFEGVVTKIHVPAGEGVPVGTVLVTIGTPGDLSGDGRAGSPPAAAVAVRAEPNGGAGAVQAMPPVRKLARELGVDLATVAGTGPKGRIERRDVEAAAGSRAEDRPPGGASGDGAPRREPLRGVRRKVAERMTSAHLTVPPVTHVEECDVTELDAVRRLANERAPEAPRLTFLPFIVKAVVAGLEAHPVLNASLDDDAGEVVYHDRYDIGIAVDTPAGLTVPVVRAAATLSLRDIAGEIDRLAAATRDGSISAADLRDATFTVTSPGRFGGLMATPIVFHPQAAILGVHRAVDRPVVRDGQIVIRKMMNLSLTFDHRILDGMTAARFCLDVIELLEDPARLAPES
ncbi:MAG: dihydrolipoamide acetyltransferase family protein [Actinomycetota bacterium]